MTYRKSSGGSLSFEGADFCAGRMTCGEVFYDVTDHLESVRSAVVGSSGSAKTYAWYGAYGSRTLARVTVPPSPEPSYRHGFTGKEDQSTEFGIPYTDFGARHFSPDLGRWLTPDPLSEKYYGISPYAYCNGDPVNLVDPDGMDWKDKWVGIAIGVATNLIPGTSGLRDQYTPTSSSDYNNALKVADTASSLAGAAMIAGGGGMMAAGSVGAEAGAAVALTGAGAPVGVPVVVASGTGVAVGAGIAATGAMLMANAAGNGDEGYSRGQESSSTFFSANPNPKSAKSLQKEVERGRAPKDILRFDHGKGINQDHVHFRDGTAMNIDGTQHDKAPFSWNHLTNKVKKYLQKYGWPRNSAD